MIGKSKYEKTLKVIENLPYTTNGNNRDVILRQLLQDIAESLAIIADVALEYDDYHTKDEELLVKNRIK